MMISILAIFALGICIIAAICDFAALRLPNILMIALLALYAQMTLMNYFAGHHIYISQIIVALGLFFITAFLFFTGIFGGGDAKMISVVGLWLGMQGLPAFLLVMSLVGLVLGLTALALRQKIRDKDYFEKIPQSLRPENGWLHSLHKGENAIPYGIAITAGVFAGFISNGYFNGILT